MGQTITIFKDLNIIRSISEEFGAQSVIGAIDYKKRFWGKIEVVKGSDQKFSSKKVVEWAQRLDQKGVGEILLTSVDRDGTLSGYDIEMVKQVSSSIDIPVIAN